MVTFTTAPLVLVGDRITSTQLVQQNLGFNDRLRSGLAEPWRIVFTFASMFRQVRNSDGLFAFPPQFEWWQVYKDLDPRDANWPVDGPGLPEGMNVANPWGAFVFGEDYAGIDSEDNRLGVVPLFYGDHVPSNDFEAWQLSKAQSGWYDETVAARSSPALDASESHFRIYQGANSPHGNDYGNFLPGPASTGFTCADGETPQFTYIITRLDGSSSDSYTGSCPENPGDLAILYESQDTIYVVTFDGVLHTYPTSEWVQGPYTGAATLRRTASKMMERALAVWASEHRGTATQRARGQPLMGEAFKFQDFITRQYLLAPARGQAVGDSISGSYPEFTISTTTSAAVGAQLRRGGSTGYPTHAGFVIAKVYVTSENLQEGSLQLEFTDNDVTFESAAFEVTAGVCSSIHRMTSARRGSPFGIRLASSITASGGTASVTVECAELVDYKPKVWDLYALIRLSGCKDLDAPLDGGGVDETSSRNMWQNYDDTGCIININGVSGINPKFTSINDNSVYDAARRMAAPVKVIPRRQFMGIDLVDGKTSLYFKRFAFNLHQGTPIDLFSGLAPAFRPTASDGIIKGNVYTVRSGTATYNKSNYATGSQFTGIGGKTTWSGTAEVYEYQGIKPVALEQDWSNEWLMGLQFKAYHPSVTSEWFWEAYADQFALNNRCAFVEPLTGSDKQLRNHFSYGNATSDGVLVAEAPDSFNYAVAPSTGANINTIPCGGGDSYCESWRQGHYRSCRIYEPWPEIESATAFIESGVELVKLTFKTRIHHCSQTSVVRGCGDAPSSFSRDETTWVAADIANECHRSWENGLRQYWLNQQTGAHCTTGGTPPMFGTPSGQPGNTGANSNIQANPDNPHGTCFPEFLFIKLVPMPFIDQNNSPDQHDSNITFEQEVQKEIYLRSICANFVDETSTVERTCTTGAGLYTYTYENLHFYANGNRWFPLVSSTDRSDNPQGYGPVPTTILRAERFNQMSRALNLLTMVPVNLPMTIEVNDESFSGSSPILPDWPSPTLCVNSASPGASVRGVARAAATSVSSTGTTGWADFSVGGLNANAGASIDLSAGCPAPTIFTNVHFYNVVSYRLRLNDPDHIYALPPTISDMVTTAAGGFLATEDENQTALDRYSVSVAGDAVQCGATPLFDFGSGTGYNFTESGGGTLGTCKLISGGSVDPMLGHSVSGDTYIQGDSPGHCNAGWQGYRYLFPLGADTDRFLVIPLV